MKKVKSIIAERKNGWWLLAVQYTDGTTMQFQTDTFERFVDLV